MIGRPPPMRERYCKGSGAAEHTPVLLMGRERGTPTWRGYTYLDYVELLERLPRGNPKKEEKFKGIRRAENSFNRGYRWSEMLLP